RRNLRKTIIERLTRRGTERLLPWVVGALPLQHRVQPARISDLAQRHRGRPRSRLSIALTVSHRDHAAARGRRLTMAVADSAVGPAALAARPHGANCDDVRVPLPNERVDRVPVLESSEYARD